MSKLKVLVACHKPGPVHQDAVYTPIHVGRSVSKYKEEMPDMMGDDTGNHISEKNPQYCELTAQYWAWKNLHDVDYIGFCHYRRYFDLEMIRVQKILSKYDVIVSRYVYDHPIWREIVNFVSIDDLSIVLMALKKKYPEYEETVINYLYGNVLYPKNMFICTKKLFDEYAEWLFGILFECEKIIRPSGYSRGKRALAYMGEYILPIYLIHHHYRLKIVEYCSHAELYSKPTIKSKIVRKIRSLYHNIRNQFTFGLLNINKPRYIEGFIPPEVKVGFENDGINL